MKTKLRQAGDNLRRLEIIPEVLAHTALAVNGVGASS